MLDEILEQNRINQELTQPDKHAIINLNIPQHNQSEAVSIIRQSNKMITSFKEKEVKLLMGKTFYDKVAKNKLTPFKLMNNESILNEFNFSIEKLQEFSLYKPLALIVVEHLQNFLEIETEINPVTKKLVEVREGMTVVEFVTKLIEREYLTLQFNLLDLIYRNPFYKEKRRRIWRPLLEFIFSNLSQLSFLVTFGAAKNLFWNEKVLEPLTEDEVKKRQSDTILEVLLKNEDRENQNFEQRVEEHMISQVVKKREMTKVEHPRFFAYVRHVTDYESMINDSLRNQNRTIVKTKENVLKFLREADEEKIEEGNEFILKKKKRIEKKRITS